VCCKKEDTVKQDQLIPYILAYSKQGYTKEQMKQFFLQRGFNEQDVADTFVAAQSEPEQTVKSKLPVVVVLVLFFVVALGVGAYFVFSSDIFSGLLSQNVASTDSYSAIKTFDLNSLEVDILDLGQGELSINHMDRMSGESIVALEDEFGISIIDALAFGFDKDGDDLDESIVLQVNDPVAAIDGFKNIMISDLGELKQDSINVGGIEIERLTSPGATIHLWSSGNFVFNVILHGDEKDYMPIFETLTQKYGGVAKTTIKKKPISSVDDAISLKSVNFILNGSMWISLEIVSDYMVFSDSSIIVDPLLDSLYSNIEGTGFITLSSGQVTSPDEPWYFPIANRDGNSYLYDKSITEISVTSDGNKFRVLVRLNDSDAFGTCRSFHGYNVQTSYPKEGIFENPVKVLCNELAPLNNPCKKRDDECVIEKAKEGYSPRLCDSVDFKKNECVRYLAIAMKDDSICREGDEYCVQYVAEATLDVEKCKDIGFFYIRSLCVQNIVNQTGEIKWCAQSETNITHEQERANCRIAALKYHDYNPDICKELPKSTSEEFSAQINGEEFCYEQVLMETGDKSICDKFYFHQVASCGNQMQILKNLGVIPQDAKVLGQ
jgi:hypothetical protein